MVSRNYYHYSLQPQQYYHCSYFFIVITRNTQSFVKLPVPSCPVNFKTPHPSLTHPLITCPKTVPYLFLTFTLLSLNFVLSYFISSSLSHFLFSKSEIDVMFLLLWYTTVEFWYTKACSSYVLISLHLNMACCVAAASTFTLIDHSLSI